MISLEDEIEVITKNEKKRCRGIAIPSGMTHTANTNKNKVLVFLFDNTTSIANLQKYDVIGFASGIDFGKFYKEIEEFAKENLPDKKQVFFLYTCAMDRKGFTNSMKEIALEKQSVILGEYGCKGYNTYGPWKVIGGMNKKHPTEDEKLVAIEFFEGLA